MGGNNNETGNKTSTRVLFPILPNKLFSLSTKVERCTFRDRLWFCIPDKAESSRRKPFDLAVLLTRLQFHSLKRPSFAPALPLAAFALSERRMKRPETRVPVFPFSKLQRRSLIRFVGLRCSKSDNTVFFSCFTGSPCGQSTSPSNHHPRCFLHLQHGKWHAL